MIGPRLRLVLKIVAWAMIVVAPVTIAVTVGEALENQIYPQGGEWRFLLSIIYGAAAPMVQGGIMLALLSIDERIQNRGA